MCLPEFGQAWTSKSKRRNKWKHRGFNTPASRDAIRSLDQFIKVECQLFEHVWKDVDTKEALRIQVEINCSSMPLKTKVTMMRRTSTSWWSMQPIGRLKKGKQKAREADGTHIAQALIDGSGHVHNITAIDHALPPLRLVIEEKQTKGISTSLTQSG